MPPTANPTSHAHAPTPVWAVLLFTFLNSIGSAVLYTGLFFIAETVYGFGAGELFGIALVYGLTYIPGARFIGPLLRRIEQAASPRTVLAWVMLAAAALCWLPTLADGSAPEDRPGAARGAWALWVVIAVYAPLSGAMWPMVEAFLAGGRSERQLRAATGKFNVCWAGAIVATMPLIGPLIKAGPLLSLQLLSGVHVVAAAVLLATFRPRPGRHVHMHVHPHPPVYRQLLDLLRVLLPTAFLFISVLSPYLPGALRGIGLPVQWATSIASAWLAARVATFLIMERWHGWHGRWSTVAFGAALLLGSFAAVVVVPVVADGRLALAAIILALAGFGVGVGVIYCAALYYAMEVGSAEVDAGGTHETLIGLGYTAGPLCGMASIWIVESGTLPIANYEPLMAAIVCGVGLLLGGWGLSRALKVRNGRGATAATQTQPQHAQDGIGH
ncbi:MAG: hypothetical protein KF869_10315 [Phycisphaeraceae bacterium]|nr:hypothetical protein [Phycisphaeraceae bacterium]